LADSYNVAQFVSFSAGHNPRPYLSRIAGRQPDERYPDPLTAVDTLLARVGTVNIRSFSASRAKGNPFHYGLDKADDVIALLESLARQGYSTIVNETIDVADGGVSGVALNDLIEFVPGDTPRGVEGSGVASLPLALAIDLLATVYGFEPGLPDTVRHRVEFSLHPLRVGYRHEHTVIWEMEPATDFKAAPTFVWPNNFSRFIGDKAFGLLLADRLGLPVPATTVVARSVPPFRFGRSTGTGEFWSRPCPSEPQPGLFPTTRGWTDPSELFRIEQSPGRTIMSILAQEGVAAAFSGATLPGGVNGDDLVEGVPGFGDDFMQGKQVVRELPADVVEDVRAISSEARRLLGPVRLEFAHDTEQAWVLQMHLSADHFQGATIVPGAPANDWLAFDPRLGLDHLRELIEQATEENSGIRVTGAVGLTSHVGDLLRKAAVPAVMSPSAADPKYPR
jgi:hypothetical protein